MIGTVATQIEGKMKPFIYDVTLRDGNQALKKPWNPDEKTIIFGFLMRLGVQGAEVGYPGASQMDFNCTVALAKMASRGMVIGALARACEADIKAAAKALQYVAEGAISRLHTFIGMSLFHMENVLKTSPEQVCQMAVDAVKLAREEMGECGEIQFSPEHFGDCEDNLDWVIESLLAVVEAGATIINLPNTVERTRPSVFATMVKLVVDAMPEHVTVAVHCHNDLGMATATTVESYFVGARQLEVTLNGLGERAGNTNLYEAVVALHCAGIDVGLNLEAFYEIALDVANMSGIPIPMKAPLIGQEVLKHRSGIHQDGAIKTDGGEKGAYRPINPMLIGRAGDEECEFTSQSGVGAVAKIIRETGRTITNGEARLLQPALKAVSEDRGVLTPKQLAAVFDAFLKLRAKKEVTLKDVLEIAKDGVGIKAEKVWELVSARVDSDSERDSTAIVCLRKDRDEFTETAFGNGPLDAAFNAIRKIIDNCIKVEDYRVEGVTPGSEAQGKVYIILSLVGNKCEGTGTGTDVVQASIKAYINALNRLLAGESNGVK